MKSTHKYIILSLTLLLLVGCSRKKDKFINRGWHAMTAYYNSMFNGKQAIIQGEAELEASFRDNYWAILPVERLQIEEQALLQGETKNANFERAEEKATKAIQKHSMYIDGEENNPQMDEAFIMLGKARYFDGRFIPAQEAFNYVLRRYPTSNTITEARVWKEKVNIRLDNNELAIENLKEILEEAEEEDLNKQAVAEAAAMLSQAYINLQQLDSAIMPIKLASETIDDKEKQARYTFIKGQLYNNIGKIDSANIAFDEVIKLNRSIPRRYLINAYVEKAKNFDLDKGDKAEFEELLTRLETYYENRPYLDRIYLVMADYYQKLDSTDLAVTYYNKSLRTQSADNYLVSRNYLRLAEINFDNAEYKEAGNYFDSTLTNLDNTTREFRTITKRRVNLDDVILYEGIARANDSILNVANLSAEDQYSYYQTYADGLKATAIAQARAEELPVTGATNSFYNKQTNSRELKGIGGPKVKGDFYFYNPTTVAYGKQEFEKVWGNRKLEDNWRTGGSVFSNTETEEEDIDPIAALEEDPRFDPQTYVDLIPKDQKVLDSLSTERNFAYYQLGLIYKEKFKEYGLASEKLEGLLNNNPEERLILPSKYNLYKVYETTGDTANADRVKNDILNNHPESRYASILRNPESLKNDENSPEAIYATLYKQFQEQNYALVLEKSEEYIQQFTGDDIVPKFELLKANAEGRYLGFEAYKEGLNFVALNYPQSDEGKQAAKIYKQSIPSLEFKEFEKGGEEGEFKLIYPIDKNDTTVDAKALREKVDKAIEDLGYTNLYTSYDVYNPFQNFLVIHGLNSSLGAEGFGELLKDNKNYKITNEFFGISSENYTIVQIHKNIDAYREFSTQ